MIRVLLALSLALMNSQSEKVQSALRTGDLQAAESLIQADLERDSDQAATYVLLGRLRLLQKRTEEAEAAFQKAIELEPGHKSHRLAFASYLKAAGRYSEARSVLEEGLREHPNDSDLFYELALISADAGSLDDAVMYLKAIPEKEAPPTYWETVAKVLVSGGDFEGAENAYRKYLEDNPGSVNTLRALSGLALKLDDSEKAWKYIAEARRIAPSSPRVIHDFTLVSLADGLPAEAVVGARTLLLLDKDNPDYQLLLARSLLANGTSLASGLEAMEVYLESRPDDNEALRLYGKGLFNDSQFQKAREVFERLSASESGTLDDDYYLAMVAFNLGGDDATAENLLQKVLAADNRHALAHQGLGRLYLRQKLYEDALSHLQASVELKEDDSDTHFQLSRVYMQLGKRELAQQAVERYRELKEEETRLADRAGGLPFITQLSAEGSQDSPQ